MASITGKGLIPLIVFTNQTNIIIEKRAKERGHGRKQIGIKYMKGLLLTKIHVETRQHVSPTGL